MKMESKMKVVLITGGTKGLELSIVKLLKSSYFVIATEAIFINGLDAIHNKLKTQHLKL